MNEKTMKHIGIIGSFGSGNLGDESAWLSIKQFFMAKEPKYKYYFHIYQWARFTGIPYGHHTTPLYLITTEELDWINKNFSAMIITGGGIIKTGWGFLNCVNFGWFLDNLKIPLYAISISADDGEYNPEELSLIKKLLHASKCFTVRDAYSQSALAKIGMQNIEITPDVVTSLKPLDEKFITPEQYKPLIAITASSCLDENFGKFWKTISEKLDKKFYAYSFVPKYNDTHTAQIINGKPEYKQAMPEEMLTIIKNADFIIAGRLHAAVYAAMTGTPFYAINYHPKVKSFCDGISYTHYYPKEPMKLDKTGYGYDFGEFDIEQVISEIKEAMAKAEKPKCPTTADSLLESIYNDIHNSTTETQTCMYCGEDTKITDKLFKCPSCGNVNYV